MVAREVMLIPVLPVLVLPNQAHIAQRTFSTCMASGTVACGALVRNRAAFSTISRCRVVFLDMLGGRGISVVAILNR